MSTLGVPAQRSPTGILEYRADIDGLRALAVLAVVMFHVFPGALPGGFVGVDIFFVISGYLISGIILKDVRAGRFSYGNFYARRIRRIFPALAVVLGGTLILGWFALMPHEYRSLGKHAAAGAGFLSNIFVWRDSNYFDTQSELKPLLHLWSLGVEEQFYIVWPFLLAVLWNRMRASFLIASILACSFLINIWITAILERPNTAFYLPFSRLWELMAGSLLAYAEARGVGPVLVAACSRLRFSEFAAREALSACGFAAVITSLLVISSEMAFPGWWALLPTIGTALLIGAGPTALLNRKLLTVRVLVWIGLISYPLYVWHWPLLSFARILGGHQPAPEVRIFLVACAFLLAYLTYQLVERPIRRLGNVNYPAAVLFATVALVGVLGVAVYRMEGVPSRFERAEVDLGAFKGMDDFRKTYKRCTFQDAELLSWCHTSGSGLPRLAILGDSHADHLFPGIAEADSAAWLLIGHSSCPPLADTAVHEAGKADVCEKRTNLALRVVADDPHIGTVVLAFLGPDYIVDKTFVIEHRPKPLREITKVEAFQNGLEGTIKLLLAANKKVVIFADIPDLRFSPEDCVDRPVRSAGNPACTIALTKVLARQENYRSAVRAVGEKFPGVRIFDSLQHLCDRDFCYGKQNGALLYRDSHHLSINGSRFLGRRFLDWLNA